MIRKLPSYSRVKSISGHRRPSWQTTLLILILCLGSVPKLLVANANDKTHSSEKAKPVLNVTVQAEIIRSYAIYDGSTEDKSCFPTKGVGVIYQRAAGCQGKHHIWRVHESLILNEYSDDTAKITGSVIDQEGIIGRVDIVLSEKSQSGNTWNAECYLDGISDDPRTFYRSFNGTITVDGEALTVERKLGEQHYILGTGAGFEPGQYGFGAWTAGSFGGCTEWFGNLDPIEIDCKLTVDAGEDQSNCNLEEIVLTANAANAYDCSVITSSYKIIDSNTEAGCFTADPGVIFQKGGSCKGIDYTWRAGDDLILNEYDNNTATITGTVIDQNGRVGIVNIKLSDKEHTGTTWDASCYLDGISGPATYYRSFYGTITADGIAVNVGTRFNAHYILANGAGFDSSQYGLGAWTGGAFGECTEWFGNLVPQTIDHSSNGVNYVWSTTDGNIISDSNQQTITVNKAGTYKVTAEDCKDCEAVDTVVITELAGPVVDAGDDVSINFGDSTTLTATGGTSYIWSTGETTASITVAPKETTTYSVMVTSEIGECTDADQVIVSVDCIMEVDLGDDLSFCEETETVLTANVKNIPRYSKIIAAYNITDADTSKGICANAHGNEQGVILQKGNPNFPVTGRYNAWKVYQGLVLNEYEDQTARITGSVIDEQGKIGIVDMLLYDKQSQGTSWKAECYLESLVGPQLFYQSFHGTIIVDGEIYTVEPKKSGHHFVLAEGASLEPGQFGFGAWTAGTFGNGGEWFGNLEPVKIEDCETVSYLWSTGETTESITVSESGEYTVAVKNCKGCEATDTIKVTIEKATADACDDVTICFGETTTLEVEGEGTYLWSNGETTQSIEVSPEDTTTYSVTVTNGECEATDDVIVTVESKVTADACDDVTICIGETTTLEVEGEGTYLWSNGETSQSIEVSPESTTTYYVTVTNGQCEATDEVIVTVQNKVIIGDYVWLDENRNGLQDESGTGVNGISVKLYQCVPGGKPGELIAGTETTEGIEGAGYYQFEVCPNSGEYYIVFGEIPQELEFTETNSGDVFNDSNANVNGRTECFIIYEEDNLSIDAGLNEICDLNVDAGETKEICANSNSIVELTATIEDGTADCPGGCVYPILEQERCFGPTGTFEIWLNSTGSITSWSFKASEQRFERLPNGDARYTATASNGVDTIEMDVTFSGYTTTPVLGSPKLNGCQDYDTSDWEYWTTWTGTIVSQNHGTYTMKMMGAPFQMGIGADTTRSGFGASGWFSTEGGDGYYTIGDVNIPLAECQENGTEYKWTTQDGNIVSDPYKKTISVDRPGTYIFEAMNCVDCYSTDKVVVDQINCTPSSTAKNSKISRIYPVPVASGGTLTMEFGVESDNATSGKAFGPQLKEGVSIVVYDMNGRLISAPRSFEIIDGKAVIYLDVDSIPSGKYIVKAMSTYWSESKQILVR